MDLYCIFMYPYKLLKYQLHSEVTRLKRIERSKKLLKKLKVGTLHNLVFSDEKLFTMEAIFNSQNDRVLSKSIQTIPKGLKKSPRHKNLPP